MSQGNNGSRSGSPFMPPVSGTNTRTSMTHSSAPSMSPPSRSEVMEGLDMRAEVTHAMHTADGRFATQALAPMPPHLHNTTEVRGIDRRSAQISTPQDRLMLAAEPRSESNSYVQLQRDTGTGTGMVPVGRAQNPSHLPPSERHLYAAGGWGAPSYPVEARHLSEMAPSHQEAFAMLRSELLAEPMAVDTPREAAHLATTANIIGIAEQRRDPYMAFASAQSIQHGAMEGVEATLPSVFGRRAPNGRGNLPGTMPASGTGAVAVFRDARNTLETGATPSASGERVIENMEAVHMDLMSSGYDQAQAQRMADDGQSPGFITEAMTARMRSAATRTAARMTGQLPYNLRSLSSGIVPPEDE